MKILETDLYKPVRDYLEGLGYTVRSEVKDCDITAVKEEELVIVELKTSFNLKLLVQAVKRQRATDRVYVAIPMPKGGKRTAAWRDVCALLRRLELGLIIVKQAALKPDGSKANPKNSVTTNQKNPIPGIEVILHPDPFDRSKSMQNGRKKRRSIIKEAEARYGDYNTGGSNKNKLMTAYRENSIHIACCLLKFGQPSPGQLKKFGTGAKTQSILKKNYYGWFQRISRGKYEIAHAAEDFLAGYPELVEYYMKIIEKAGSNMEETDL
jgi:hypothetical protein